jgi:hypothetical protein
MTATPQTAEPKSAPTKRLGFTIIGGMLAASGIAIFLIPLTFYVVERLSSRKHASSQAPQPERQVTPTAEVPS